MNEVTIRLGNREVIICQPNKLFITNDGDEYEALNLKGKRLMPNIKDNADFDLEFMLFGFVQGDGQLTRLVSETHQGIEVNVGFKDNEVRMLFKNNYKITDKDYRSIYVSGIKYKLIELGFDPKVLPERVFPSTYNKWDYKRKASFLRGCYSANGSVINVGRVTYKTTCKQFAEELKQTLIDDFNINPYITTNKSHDVKFSNGTYTVKESYDINIQQYDSRIKFYNNIGFIHKYKMNKLHNHLIEKAPIVVNVIIN